MDNWSPNDPPTGGNSHNGNGSPGPGPIPNFGGPAHDDPDLPDREIREPEFTELDLTLTEGPSGPLDRFEFVDGNLRKALETLTLFVDIAMALYRPPWPSGRHAKSEWAWR